MHNAGSTSISPKATQKCSAQSLVRFPEWLIKHSGWGTAQKSGGAITLAYMGKMLLHFAVLSQSTIGIDYRESTKDWIDTGFIRYIGKNI